MTDKPWYPDRWPPQDPDLIQLYSMATPNGQKVSIALEEMDLPYEAHLVDISRGDQHQADFARLSPNGKIPALLDPHGPEDQPVILMESIAILTYLSDKTGKFLPMNYLARMDHLQWLVFQAAHVGPMFGQFGHFYKFARDKVNDPYPLQRYTDETRRLLRVLDERLQGRDYIMDDYSIVDMAMVPWVNCLEEFYEAGDHLGLDTFGNVELWRRKVSERPGFRKGRQVCAPERSGQ